MRKTRGIFVVLCVTFCMALLLVPARAEAASAKSKALKAYRELLSQETIQWGTTGETVTLADYKFALLYLDNDSVPELLIYNGSYASLGSAENALLYTYKNKKAKYICSLRSPSSYYKKKGILLDDIYYGRGATSFYCKFSGSKVTEVLSEAFSGGSYYYCKISGSKQTYITEKAFKKRLKKLVGAKKTTTIKYYENTAANRKKYL